MQKPSGSLISYMSNVITSYSIHYTKLYDLTSRTPLKIAGKPRLLLTWLGKSLLPVATIRAPASSASQGQISGIGFAHAKTMAWFAMVFIHSFFIVFGPGFEAATTARNNFV